jgi:hypothetical protein
MLRAAQVGKRNQAHESAHSPVHVPARIRTTSASRVRLPHSAGRPGSGDPENKRQELHQESGRRDLPDRFEFVRAKHARALDKE